MSTEWQDAVTDLAAPTDDVASSGDTIQSDTDTDTDEHGPTPVLIPLDAPRDGVPAVISTVSELHAAAERLAAGTGPVAVDAERASGHRYGQRAFLVQLRREGAGTILLDPSELAELSVIQDAIGDAEWVLHAASQDLPCLGEIGLRPTLLFDTELGCRLAGMAKVGLAAAVEQFLGLSLAKEHSAVDWSKRPLPEPWLRYAALDVEVLVDLRDQVAAELDRQGKLDWARQEFAAVVAAPAPAPRVDPWRRTSGMHRLRTRRQLAMMREIWLARDAQARSEDVSPGRLVPDAALVAAVLAGVSTVEELLALKDFTGRGARRHARLWAGALARGQRLPEAELPPQHLAHDGPPPPRVWAEKNPAAARRLGTAKEAIAQVCARVNIPVENLVSPELIRRLAWSPPASTDVVGLGAALRDGGARAWQVELIAGVLAQAWAVEPAGKPA